MFEIKKSVKNLIPYKPNIESCRIKLDANESKNYLFEDGLSLVNIQINLYPDTESISLRKALSTYINFNFNQILVGNGSSEMIELILKTYIEKNDVVLSFEPSFGMYKIYAQIYDANFIGVPSSSMFEMDINQMILYAKKYQPKIIFLCTPNNPTGQILSKEDIEKILIETKSLIVLDEAYMEFMDSDASFIPSVNQYENLIVLRTMSKAFGLAGIRLGYMVSNQTIINQVFKIKSPYNLNALSQYVGRLALSQLPKMDSYTSMIKNQREILYHELKSLGIRVFPSQANFLFFQSNIKDLFNKLVEKDVLIRPFKNELDGYYRVTIGLEDENKYFIQAIKEIINETINNH